MWIGLICLLSMLPLMILFEKPMAYYLFENEAIHDWSGIAPSILILIGWVCATAQTIFRTRLLYLAYLQPREQETDVLFIRGSSPSIRTYRATQDERNSII